MGGLGDHVSIPSPRSFFSSIYNDEAMSRSSAESHSDNRSGTPFGGPSTQVPLRDANANNMALKNEVNYETSKSGGGGLMERMVARAGFNAPRLDMENIKPVDFSENQEIWSPYLTIPPGLSPATLLESPIFISNPQILPSPTTGKLFGDANAASFASQPVTQSSSSLDYGAFTKENPYQQSFPNTKVSAQPENSLLPGNMEPWNINSGGNSTFFRFTNFSTFSAVNKDSSVSSNPRSCHPVGFEQFASLDKPQEVGPDQRSENPANDGFNWRKYGQKQVKKCEYPRSYYKCTHFDCLVKKKVERSHEGEITEIIYKGTHNHPKPPPPNRRSTLGSVGVMQPEPPQAVADGNQIWSTVQQTVPPVWRRDNLEPKSSAPLTNEALSFQGHGGTRIETGEGVGGSSIVSDDEDEGGEEELESKRRRIETSSPDTNGSARGVREPRVVVQTVSEVDILDDGYRWRKYGQKVVKGNPNPRSYYKCTSQGCNVRKHIERAAHDPLSVITTYEGKHNHLVPAARNSINHLNLGTHIPATGPSNIQKTEASQILNSMARSEGPSSLSLFGLRGRPQLGPTLGPSFGPGPGFGFGYGMNQPMPGLLPSRGKLPVLPTRDVRPSFGQLNQIDNGGLMLPKGEPKRGPVRDPGVGVSSSSSVYRPNMGRWSRGPQI